MSSLSTVESANFYDVWCDDINSYYDNDRRTVWFNFFKAMLEFTLLLNNATCRMALKQMRSEREALTVAAFSNQAGSRRLVLKYKAVVGILIRW